MEIILSVREYLRADQPLFKQQPSLQSGLRASMLRGGHFTLVPPHVGAGFKPALRGSSDIRGTPPRR
jgi:hypothetical protein